MKRRQVLCFCHSKKTLAFFTMICVIHSDVGGEAFNDAWERAWQAIKGRSYQAGSTENPRQLVLLSFHRLQLNP